MKDATRIGLIGAGAIAQLAHLPVLSKVRGAQLVAICDNDRAKARALADRFDIPDTFTDIEDMLTDESVDAVVVATPDHWHALMTVMACQAGKDVYVEKPMSHNIWEGRKMIEAARRLSQEPHTYWTDQLNNYDSLAGYYPLAEEIWTASSGFAPPVRPDGDSARLTAKHVESLEKVADTAAPASPKGSNVLATAHFTDSALTSGGKLRVGVPTDERASQPFSGMLYFDGSIRKDAPANAVGMVVTVSWLTE